MQKKKKSVTNWCIQAPKALDILLEDAVKNGTFSNKSDLVRSSVRNTLKEMEIQNSQKEKP